MYGKYITIAGKTEPNRRAGFDNTGRIGTVLALILNMDIFCVICYIIIHRIAVKP